MASPGSPFDRVMETTTTTGTGTLTLLGAVSGFQALSVVGDGNTAPYALWSVDANGIPNGSWETGFGTYTLAGTLWARTSCLQSSNGNNFVNFSAGTKRIALGMPAAYSDINNGICQGRLTLTSGTAVTQADVTGATSIFFTPYLGNRVALFNGTGWRLYQFSELTLALGTLSSGANYDVFLFDNSGTLTLESLAWSSNTSRATAINLQDGVYCRSGSLSHRYLGTFRTTATTTTEDSGGGTVNQTGGKRFLWNMYNRVNRHMSVIDTTDNWTYATATWRQAAAHAGNKVEYVVGLAEDSIDASVIQCCSADLGAFGYTGIGVDTITDKSPTTLMGNIFNNNNLQINFIMSARYVGCPTGIGYHYIAWVENGGGSGVGFTFLGDNGETDLTQSGLAAMVRG